MSHQQECQGHEGRIAVIASVTNLFVIKPAIVLSRRVSQSVMMRMVSLNQDSPRQVTTARATGDLGYQLKRSFGGAKVGKSKAGIDRNNANQSDVRKIVSLRQHLRADEQIDFSFGKIQQALFEFVTA